MKLYKLIAPFIALSLVNLFAGEIDESNADPYEQVNNSSISISGTVTASHPDKFNLDYGDGQVVVEMDDWQPDKDGYQIFPGDEVVVYGIIDDDLFERTTIEASSVYVKNLNTYFYANSADEEDISASAMIEVMEQNTAVSGVITEINGDEFVINREGKRVTVDTSELGYDPLDEQGAQQLEIGDRVRVFGYIDDDWWEGREVMADVIISLS